MKTRHVYFFVALMVGCVANAQKKAAVPSFLTDGEMPDATRFVEAPPELNSTEFQHDVYYYQWGKEQRAIPEVAKQAAYDEAARTSEAFSQAAGLTISPEQTPEIFKLVEGVRQDANKANTRAKKYYRRKRPFAHFNEPSLVTDYDSVEMHTFSFPSGHATRGYAYALALACIVPDSTDALLARARQYAVNRVVCGRHYMSDVDASLFVADAVLCRLASNKAFQKQLKKARKEYARIKRGRK